MAIVSLAGLLAALAAMVVLVVILQAFWIRRLSRLLRESRFQGRSLATRHGQVAEQFAPFLATWPWDPKGFRFIGSPIDGLQFTPDGVVFVEIKTGGSRLSPLQAQVRDHVEAGRVSWKEVRIG